MKNVLPPFKIFFLKDSSYTINGGKVINYFNSANFRNVKNSDKTADIPVLTNNLSANDIYSFSGLKKVEFFLMCSFKAPKDWVPGLRFSPLIDECWIVRKETESDDDIVINGSIENSSVDHIRFDSAFDILYGYACNLGKIGEIETVDGEQIVRQAMVDNYWFSLLFSTSAYAIYNNSIGILPTEESFAAYQKLKSNLNRYLYRGYAITSNTALVVNGFDSPLPANTIPSTIGRFVENHPEL